MATALDTASLDIVLRTITVMAAVLLAALLLTTCRRQQPALPGAVLALAAGAFFVTSAPGAEAKLDIWDYPLTALCVTKAVWFWLFARALFRDDGAVRGRDLMIVGLIAIAGTWQQEAFLPQYREGVAGALEIAAGFGVEGTLLALVLLGLYEAGRDMTVDLVERRRRLRVGFMLVTGAYLVMTLGVQTYNLVADVSTPALARQLNAILVAAVFLAAAWSLLKPRRDTWLDSTRSTGDVALSPAETAALARLKEALETDRIFFEEGLTIAALAERLGTGEHVLRPAINRGLGYRNFNDFLNACRIREACDELARPEQARVPVLSIAMKVGYGSVGTFNRAFKARIGMTPSAYRRKAIKGT